MQRETVFVTLSICITIVAASAIIAQGGPLDPPQGPISSTYKTLDEIEPRIPIDALPFDITETGSYYLTANLSGSSGISVSAPGVTIDLMGHSLIRVGGQGPTAIGGDDAATGLVIRNGRLTGWGSGVLVEDIGDISIENMRFESIDTNAIVINEKGSVTECVVRDCGGTAIAIGAGSVVRELIISGSGGDGLVVGDRSVIEAAQVSDSGANGIVTGDDCGLSGCVVTSSILTGYLTGEDSVMTRCSAQTSGEIGFDVGAGSVVTSCTSANNGLEGFDIGAGSTLSGSTARSNGRDGIQGGFPGGSSIIECVSIDNNNFGIDTSAHCLIERCAVEGNENGIRASGSNCRVIGNVVGMSTNNGLIVSSGQGTTVDSNTVTGQSKGIWVTGSDNIITRICVQSFFDYDIASGNAFGPIVDVDGDGDIADTPGADHPWVNFSY